jgi:hypothetical protein
MTRRTGRGHPQVSRAHARNEEPWEPLAGHTKRRCVTCEFWFSAKPDAHTCPECLEREARGKSPLMPSLRLK